MMNWRNISWRSMAELLVFNREEKEFVMTCHSLILSSSSLMYILSFYADWLVRRMREGWNDCKRHKCP